MIVRRLLAAGALLALVATAAAARTRLVVISGIGGDAEYRDRFYEWSTGLLDAAIAAGIDPADTIYLAEDPELAPDRIRAASRREEVEKALREVAKESERDDVLWIVLFGHGSARSGAPKFNLPGPDMTADDFAELLAGIRARTIVFVNAASASADFVPRLAGPGRVIVTATRSAAEELAPEFGGFFVEGFAKGGADIDKNERISLLEAFDYAEREVARSYEADQRMRTEHALLDDDGDGVGSLEPKVEESSDGPLASRTYLDVPREARTGGGEAAELVARRERLEADLAALRATRSRVSEDEYLQRLEPLLLEISQIGERLREIEGSPPAETGAGEETP